MAGQPLRPPPRHNRLPLAGRSNLARRPQRHNSPLPVRGQLSILEAQQANRRHQRRVVCFNSAAQPPQTLPPRLAPLGRLHLHQPLVQRLLQQQLQPLQLQRQLSEHLPLPLGQRLSHPRLLLLAAICFQSEPGVNNGLDNPSGNMRLPGETENKIGVNIYIHLILVFIMYIFGILIANKITFIYMNTFSYQQQMNNGKKVNNEASLLENCINEFRFASSKRKSNF